MSEPIRTKRLILRPFETDDIPSAFEWFGDPGLMRYALSGPDAGIEQTASRIASYQRHQNEYGFSKWVIISRASDLPIGDAGLLVQPEHGWIDFGYRLKRPFWGKGLATEAGSAWIKKAFEELSLERLTGIVHPDNQASIRVLQKLGFVRERRTVVMGMESIVHHLTPKQWLGEFKTPVLE